MSSKKLFLVVAGLFVALFCLFAGPSLAQGLVRGTGVVSVVGKTAAGTTALVVGPYRSPRSVTLYLADTSERRVFLPGDSVVFTGRVTWHPSGGQLVITRASLLEFIRRVAGFSRR